MPGPGLSSMRFGTSARDTGPGSRRRSHALCRLVAYRRGEFAQAEALFDEARRLLSGQVANEQAVVSFFTRGDLALAQGQFDQAATLYEEELAPSGEPGMTGEYGICRPGSPPSHTGAGTCRGGDAVLGKPAPVARLAFLATRGQHAAWSVWHRGRNQAPSIRSTLAGGRPKAAPHSSARPLWTRDLPIRDCVVTTLRSALGEVHFSAAREAGRALSVDEATAEARAVVEEVWPISRISLPERCRRSPAACRRTFPDTLPPGRRATWRWPWSASAPRR